MMSGPNTTRRRIVQGAGAIGVASVVGSTMSVAQEEEDGVGEDGGDMAPAVRVAHASPDAPNVDVRLEQAGGAAGDTGAQEGDDQNGGQEEDEETGETVTEDLGFRDVSEYTEVEPGTYRAQVVAAGDEGVLEGLREAIFGDDDEEDEEPVLFDEEIEIQDGTTYTIVAFGEAAQTDQFPVSAPGDAMGEEPGDGADGAAGDGDDGMDQDENGPAQDDDGAAQEDGAADDPGAGEPAEEGAQDRGFQVQVLEDDLTDPGEDMFRLRVFHAVPDVDAVSISTVDEEEEDGAVEEEDGAVEEEDGAAPDGDGMDQDGDGAAQEEGDATGAQDGAPAGETLIEELAFGESDTFELEAGDYTLEFSEAQPAGDGVGEPEEDDAMGDDEDGAAGDGDDGMDQDGNGPAQDDDGAAQDGAAAGGRVQEAEISPSGSTAYSGFALGYFDPEAAAGGDEGMEDEDDGAVPDEDGMDQDGDDPAQDDDAAQEGEDGENGAAQEGEEVAEEDAQEEFEFVTVEDAQEGERSEGGTNGFLKVAPVSRT